MQERTCKIQETDNLPGQRTTGHAPTPLQTLVKGLEPVLIFYFGLRAAPLGWGRRSCPWCKLSPISARSPGGRRSCLWYYEPRWGSNFRLRGPRSRDQTKTQTGSRHCLRNGFDAGADGKEVILWEIEHSWSRGAVSVAIKCSWSVFAAIRLHHRHSLRVVAGATGGERRTPRPSTSPSEAENMFFRRALRERKRRNETARTSTRNRSDRRGGATA